MSRPVSKFAASVFSNSGRAALLGSVLGAGLFAGVTSASAVELTVWSGYPEMAPFYQHVADSMKAAHPDLSVKVEAIPLREHEKRVALGVTSGGAADVIELAVSTATRYLDNELMAQAPDDVTKFVNDPANYNEFFRNAASYNGKVYALPLFRGQSALFYNTDMFKAAGLTTPPKTMDDFSTYAAKLVQRDASGNPTVSGWSMRLSGGGQGIAEKFWINMFQFGGNLLEQAPDGKWKATYASEAGHKALKQYLQNVAQKNVTVEMPADAEAFERGQTAMFIRESWVIGDIATKAPNLKYATATLPMGSIVAPVNLYITGTGDKAKAAWEFAMAANTPENQLWLLDNVGWLPNRSGLDFSKIVAAKPNVAAFVEYPSTYKFFSLPTIGPADEVLTRVAAKLTDAFANPALANDDAAIDKVLADAQAETNSILKREGILAE
ncbi:MAG: sugar transporter substrate-binding protein [Hyphomicrobiales bacterium]|nr:sugar transporter substrate-binding protein [Hyphomicrobiales bacterium]